MNDYWKNRVLQNEQKAQKYAGKALKRTKKLYNNTYKQISNDIDDLAFELFDKGVYGTLSRSELWQYKKYVDLQQKITTILHEQSNEQIQITTIALENCFAETIGKMLEEFDTEENIGFTILNKNQTNQVLNTAWSGKNYSARIYDTNSMIGERIKKDITDMVITGKNPTRIKEQLSKDLSISYSYADRLVRTEASHVFNEAAKQSYKEAGVEQIEVLVEEDNDICDECENLKGIYKIGTEPRLPAHPNCRCCYVPVVE